MVSNDKDEELDESSSPPESDEREEALLLDESSLGDNRDEVQLKEALRRLLLLLLGPIPGKGK